jgi:hypothetical protein
VGRGWCRWGIYAVEQAAASFQTFTRDESSATKRKGSSSFLKKSTKKLLLSSMRGGRADLSTNKVKVSWFFFSKKNCFLYGLYVRPPARHG